MKLWKWVLANGPPIMFSLLILTGIIAGIAGITIGILRWMEVID